MRAAQLFLRHRPSAASAAYIDSTKTATGDAGQTNLILSVNGDLGAYGIKSPFATNASASRSAANIARTRSNRSRTWEFIAFNEDYPISGKSSVTEFFGEATVPLVEDVPFLKLLSVEGAYRYSSYKDSVQTDTFKLGVNWAPVSDLRLRASYQQAVRAPNLIELYAAQLRQQSIQLPINANGTYDPCSGTTPFASFAQCARTGVTAAQYGNVSDYNFFGQLSGGNPNLSPETGKTLTVGGVLEPSFIPGLTASVDFYRIKVDNLIGTVAPTLALTQCLTTGNAYFCSLIHRGQGGTLHATEDAYFSVINVNTGSLKTSGVDVSLNYRFNPGTLVGGDLGRLTFNLAGTYLDEYTTTPLPTSGASEIYDCAGFYAFLCGSPHPKWRHTFAATWDTPWDFSLTTSWRYTAKVNISRSSDQVALKGSYSQIDYELGAQSYFDVSAAWSVRNNVTVRLGVNNVLDRAPPLTSQSTSAFGGNLNTYPAYYDALGRYGFLSAQIDL